MRHFNPHEREARDDNAEGVVQHVFKILIHTSVKLVTRWRYISGWICNILIHTSVKLVTHRIRAEGKTSAILIHTSVKLVTATYGFVSDLGAF